MSARVPMCPVTIANAAPLPPRYGWGPPDAWKVVARLEHSEACLWLSIRAVSFIFVINCLLLFCGLAFSVHNSISSRSPAPLLRPDVFDLSCQDNPSTASANLAVVGHSKSVRNG